MLIVGTGRTDHNLSSAVFRIGTAFVGVSEYFAKPGEFASLLVGPDNHNIQNFSGSLDTGLELRLDDGSVVVITRYKITIKPADASAEGVIYDKACIGKLDLMCNESGVVSALGGNPTEYYAANSISTLIYKDAAKGYTVTVSYNMLKNSITKIEMTYNPFV